MSLSAAENHEQLNKHNVGLVLTVASRLPVASLPNHIEHIRISIDDHPMANFLDVTEKCREILSKAAATATMAPNYKEEATIRTRQYDERKTEQEQKKTSTITMTHKTILVHCASGISRSAAAVMVFLMDPNHASDNAGTLSLEDALAAVQKYRPLAKPNQGFIRQLRVLEKNGGLLSNAITEWHERGYSLNNIMENVANQRREANEIHAEVDQFEVNAQIYLSAVAKLFSTKNTLKEVDGDDTLNDNSKLLQQKKYLLGKANELSNQVEKRQHENSEDTILMDKPAKSIFKSARSKLERLICALEEEKTI